MANSDRPDRFGFGVWNVSNVGTNAGVTVTHTLDSRADHCVAASIQASGDAAAVVTVESPASTILYRKRFTAAFVLSETFSVPLSGASGQNILIKISASTANCEANMQGWDSR